MPSKTKVIHVITTIENGGAENQLLILATRQASLGMDITVAYLKGLNTLQAKLEASGIKVLNLSGRYGILSKIFNLRNQISLFDGIIHAHLPEAEIVSAFAKGKNSALVISRHFGGSFFPKYPGLISRLLSRFCIYRSDAIIAISNAVKKYLYTSSEVSPHREISVVHYGFEPKVFSSSNHNLKNEFDVLKESNTLIIGTVARLSPEKDIPTFLRGFSLSLKANSNLKAVIAGSGSDMDTLVSLSEQLKISNKVVFLGKVQNVANLMRVFDMFILTSKFEGFGMVLVEAMSIGLPIIATDISAIPEVVGNGGPGLLFPVGDEVALSSYIGHLSLNSELRENLSIKGKEWVKQFSVEDMTSRILLIYQRIFTS
jgi:glycosyltransferase involved in cell wall biosynthesis